MRARISELNRFRTMKVMSIFCVASILAACAKDPPPLIADPASARDTALPWNEQTKWERDGSAAGLNTAGRH